MDPLARGTWFDMRGARGTSEMSASIASCLRLHEISGSVAHIAQDHRVSSHLLGFCNSLKRETIEKQGVPQCLSCKYCLLLLTTLCSLQEKHHTQDEIMCTTALQLSGHVQRKTPLAYLILSIFPLW